MTKTYLTLVTIFFLINLTFSQNLDLNKTPKDDHLNQGKSIAKNFFENLENRKHKENADYIVNNIGNSWEESKKITERNSYLSKFEIISMKPPKGLYGDLNGYDLIEEGFLKGSDRYFRHTYLGYFEDSFLIFEFRFYVKTDGKVTLHYIGWSENNPFEYMSTADMLLPRYN